MGQRLLAASPPCHDAKSSQHNNEAPAIVHRVAVLLHHSATESHKTSKSSGRKVSSVQLNSRYGVTGTVRESRMKTGYAVHFFVMGSCTWACKFFTGLCYTI